ncbi:MAG: V-type ATP synthase subunit E family protein [Lentimicrobium sp.]|jgi:V/A-type H+-transporting ATPase subunit E|nr:V-type ATP synthase subunit E family protein [Lentimicrobium sp.]
MENKLQELTRKIYSEGVEKATEEANLILDKAQKEADELKKKARKEAEEIINEATKKAEEMKRNAQSEMRMSSKQAISALRQQIASLVTAKVVHAPVKEAVNDKTFMGDMIRKALENFNNEATLVMPKADEKALELYFGNRLNSILKAGVEVRFDDKIKGGFKIGPKDNSYLISFTDEDFDAFFRSFMRPRSINLLFGAE